METDNELIAEFMGREITGVTANHNEPVKVYVVPNTGKGRPIVAEYSSSWDWLMPVVEKIEKLHSANFHYDFKEIKIGHWPKDGEYMEVIAMPLATPIAEVYQEVVKFIKWHNAQTK